MKSLFASISEGWFETLKGVLSKHNLFDRPNAIFNVDESGFFDDPGRRSVVIKRSTKHVIASQSGTGKADDNCSYLHECKRKVRFYGVLCSECRILIL